MLRDSRLSFEECEQRIDEYRLNGAILTHEIDGIDGNIACVYEIDVPGDGHCFYYATMMAFLMPAINDADLFARRFRTLFGEHQEFTEPEQLRALFTNYDGGFKFLVRHQTRLTFLAFALRANLASFMQRHRGADIANYIAGYDSENEDDPQQPMLSMNERVNRYYDRLTQTNEWAGQLEISSMAAMLEVHLMMYRDVEDFAEDGEVARFLDLQEVEYSQEMPNVIRLAHINDDHYRILMNPDVFESRNLARQALAVQPLAMDEFEHESESESESDSKNTLSTTNNTQLTSQPIQPDTVTAPTTTRQNNFYQRHRKAIFIGSGALAVTAIAIASVFSAGALPAIVGAIVAIGVVSKILAAFIGIAAISLAGLGTGALLGGAANKVAEFFENLRKVPKQTARYVIHHSSTKKIRERQLPAADQGEDKSMQSAKTPLMTPSTPSPSFLRVPRKRKEAEPPPPQATPPSNKKPKK